MNLIVRIARHIDALYRLRGNIRRLDRKYKERFEAIEALIANVRAAPDGPLDAILQNRHHFVPLIITERLLVGADSTGYPSQPDCPIDYFRARRMELDPAPYAGEAYNLWRKDPDDDTGDYFVMATPGNCGLFVGCRIWAVLSHEARIWGFDNEIQYEGDVFIPISGEHLGFFGYINGVEDSENPGRYPWTQVNTGLSFGDSYYSGLEIPASGEIAAFTFPKALQLESLSRDATFTGGYQEIPGSTPVFIRWVGGSLQTFVFNHYTLPESDEEC